MLSSNSSSDYPETSRGGGNLSSHDSNSINSDEDNVDVKSKVDLRRYRTWGDLTSIVGNEIGYDADTEAKDKEADDLPECEIDELQENDDIDASSPQPLPSRRRRHELRRRLSNIKKSVRSTLSKLCCFCC